jgi:hypothetical protein
MIVDGQVRQGARIGTRWARLFRQGQPLASTMLDYLLPGRLKCRTFSLHMETLSPHTEFGMKGIGEGGDRHPPRCFGRSTTPCVPSAAHDPSAHPGANPEAIEAGACCGRRRGHEARALEFARGELARLRPYSARRTAVKAAAGGQSPARC